MKANPSKRSGGGRKRTDAATEDLPLQDTFLSVLQKEQLAVSVYLVSGIRLEGHIESFDAFTVVVKNSTSQTVFKHAIATIVPRHT